MIKKDCLYEERQSSIYIEQCNNYFLRVLNLMVTSMVVAVIIEDSDDVPLFSYKITLSSSVDGTSGGEYGFTHPSMSDNTL